MQGKDKELIREWQACNHIKKILWQMLYTFEIPINFNLLISFSLWKQYFLLIQVFSVLLFIV